MAQQVRPQRRQRRTVMERVRTAKNIKATLGAQTFLTRSGACRLCKTTGEIGLGWSSYITGRTIPCTNCGGTGYIWVTKDWVKWTIALAVGAVLFALLIALMNGGVVKSFDFGAMNMPEAMMVAQTQTMSLMGVTTPIQVLAGSNPSDVHQDGDPPPVSARVQISIAEVL